VRALTYAGPGTISVDDVPMPDLQRPTDALVRVRLAGLCGSDLHIVRGKVPEVGQGTVLGHEFVGDVVEAGAAAGVEVGRRYLGGFFAACGACRSCLRRQWRNCRSYQVFGHGATLGSLDGAQAEYVRVPLARQTLMPVPDSVSDRDALFCCDILPSAWTALDQAGIRPGDTVAVVGAGPVGLMTALAADHFGAARVVVVDPVEERKAAARKLGAEAFGPDELDAALAVVSTGEDEGADVVVEAAGVPSSLPVAWRLARRGGTVALVGMLIEEQWPASAGETWLKWLTIRPIFGDAYSYRPALLALIAAGRLQPSQVLSDVFPLTSGTDAYARLASQSGLKLALDTGYPGGDPTAGLESS
jgi:threonine dehydrogenase-like Zn-dependent dehydrogenase